MQTQGYPRGHNHALESPLEKLLGAKLLPNPCSCAGCTVRPNKAKRRRLEQRKVYRRATQRAQAAHAPKTQAPQWVQEIVFPFFLFSFLFSFEHAVQPVGS